MTPVRTLLGPHDQCHAQDAHRAFNGPCACQATAYCLTHEPVKSPSKACYRALHMAIGQRACTNAAGFNAWMREAGKEAYVPKSEVPIDHLYIDVNSLLHMAIRRGGCGRPAHVYKESWV